MKNYSVVLSLCVLVGCAQGRLDIIDPNGKVIGECSAHFDWHWYGAQDSVNYILQLCAQQYIAKGYTVSDEPFLANNYTLPLPPIGSSWNKKIAKEEFNAGNVSEQKYGYILAAIEYKYTVQVEIAASNLAKNLISKNEYEQILVKAKFDVNGA